MYDEFVKSDYFISMLDFQDIYQPYIEKFDDQHEYLQQLIQYIREREREVGIFAIYSISSDLLTTELENILFHEEMYGSDAWKDTLGIYGIPCRINVNDYLILRRDDLDRRYQDITVITFLQL